MKTWKIYYDDDIIVDSLDKDWKECPSYGVLFVIEYLGEEKKMVHMGMDYYFVRNNDVISCGLASLHDHLTLGVDPGAMKFGRWTSDETWNRIHEKVFGPS